MYDVAVYLTDEEYKAKTGNTLNIQAIVEEPQIHLIGVASDSDSDQLKFVERRINGIEEYAAPIFSQNGTMITDKLRYVSADTPAKQFEAGCQSRGKRTCVSCGCLTAMHDDYAYCFQNSLLCFEERQSIATSGKFGKQAGAVKPSL